jgi:6-pyruvoyltetrahydropterin/6-carboxytetrahydropterin synthase
MWVLRKEFGFEAAHHLPQHDGKCRRVHGHSWRGEIEVVGHALEQTGPKAGMVIDYGELSDAIARLLDDVLDHHDLNQTTGLINPTSEEIARFVFRHLARRVPGLRAITIHETCTSACRYESADH